jgi:hypothetical protein
MTTTTPETEEFGPRALQGLLDGRYCESREQIREVLSGESRILSWRRPIGLREAGSVVGA